LGEYDRKGNWEKNMTKRKRVKKGKREEKDGNWKNQRQEF
jgi:hypothetical protein